MCGIVGCWHKDKRPVSSELLESMRDRMISRGPDDAGLWVNGSLGMGHRRLSILDLSPLGHQPMVDEETGSVICYNGEVYNFQELRQDLEKYGVTFRSHSDTEVILKAYRIWGERCVERFNGMFAFAIWDPNRNSMFLARDRMGIKPLYYFSTEHILLYASRLGALLQHPACPRDIDIEALGLYLEVGFVPAPWSILKDVKKLPPGYTLHVDCTVSNATCYWNIDAIPEDTSLEKASEQELVDQLEDLLKTAVKFRQIADVPLGAFLSGGVDSSTIAALMCQVSDTPPRTFTIGFKEKQYDESGYARDIAQHLGTEHHERIMASQDLLALLDENTFHYDEPFADWSSLPTMLVSRFAREHVTVCLSGDGGDEMFAGYHYYALLAKLRYLYFLPQFFRKPLGIVLHSVGKHKLSLLGHSLKLPDLPACFTFMRSMLKDYGRHTLLKESALSLNDLFMSRSRQFSPLDSISKACRLDAVYYLPDDILQKVDVASMSVSLEARVPLLDHRVVEFAQALPMKFKRRHGTSKWLLRQVLARYVPAHLFTRPKGGFVAPIHEWFRGELKEMIQNELSPARLQRFGYLQPEGVQRLLDLHLSGKRNTHPMLWLLMSLLRWDEHIRRH